MYKCALHFLFDPTQRWRADQEGRYGTLPCVGLNRKERIAALERKKQQIANRIVRLRNQESSKQRKIETRRKILAGAWTLHQAERDPAERQRLIQGLDGFLVHPRDRELFDLPPNKENEKDTPDTAAAPTGVSTADPLPGWRPHHLKTGDWGSIYLGDTSILPSELVGARITMQSKDGQSWTTTVTAVLDRSSEQVIVTNSGRPK